MVTKAKILGIMLTFALLATVCIPLVSAFDEPTVGSKGKNIIADDVDGRSVFVCNIDEADYVSVTKDNGITEIAFRDTKGQWWLVYKTGADLRKRVPIDPPF